MRKELKVEKPNIYKERLLNVAGIQLSLDDIEHGILRKNRLKWTLGYLPNLFANKVLKQLALLKIDYRIHFALNCEAKSCHPIAFYNLDKIDKQLKLASLTFIENETDFDHSDKIIFISNTIYVLKCRIRLSLDFI